MSWTDNPTFLEARAAQGRADEERAVQQPTLRDQFAMAALSGFCANPALTEMLTVTDVVQKAFRAADAMMEARKT